MIRRPIGRGARCAAVLFLVVRCGGGGGAGGGAGGGPGGGPGVPTVGIECPDGTSVLMGTTTIRLDVSASVVEVQLLLDGADLGPKLVTAPWEWRWDTTAIGDGPHELGAVARDQLGNEVFAPPIPIDTDNTTTLPKLVVESYFGGLDHDTVRDVFVDIHGYIYLAGGSDSADLPATPGAYDTSANGNVDVYVAKLTPDGGSLVFATYLGGPNYDRAYAIEVDASGHVYVAGRAGNGFPTTAGSAQPGFGGDVNPGSKYGPQDGFVAKLLPDGSDLVWCTYFGSDDGSVCRDLDVDALGRVAVSGTVDRPHWAVTPGAFDTTLDGASDGIVAMLAADGASVVWGAYFGGSSSDGGTPSCRFAPDGTLWVLSTSQSDDFPVRPGAYQQSRAGLIDMVLLHASADGAVLLDAGFFGGSDIEYSETHGLFVADDGSVTIAATTTSPDLPFAPAMIPPPFQPDYGGSGGTGTGAGTDYPGDLFVARFDARGRALLAFTYLGGNRGEGAEGVAVDPFGRVCVSGATYSNNFPVTGTAPQPRRAGDADGFLACLSSDLATLEWSTFYGGTGEDLGRCVGCSPLGEFVGAGSSDSIDLTTTAGALQQSYGGNPQDGWVIAIER